MRLGYSLPLLSRPIMSTGVARNLFEISANLSVFRLKSHPNPLIHVKRVEYDQQSGISMFITPLCLCHQHKRIPVGGYVTKDEIIDLIKKEHPSAVVG